jgi:plastocyanin
MTAHSRRSALIRWYSLALTAGLALGACSSSTSPSAGPTITIRDFSFSPSTLTVKPGTTVEWLNDGPSSHTTTSDAALWDSGPLSPPSGSGAYSGGSGGTFSYTFMTPGTYTYHCSLYPATEYPAFVGSVVVSP